jgi:hypothetical protein
MCNKTFHGGSQSAANQQALVWAASLLRIIVTLRLYFYPSVSIPSFVTVALVIIQIQYDTIDSSNVSQPHRLRPGAVQRQS